MKKNLFIVFVLFLSINAKGQNKIDGIGKIKLGMSIEQVCEIVQSDMVMKEHYWQVDGVKSFQVKNYIPVEGYYLKGMILWFYEDKLYEIETSSTDSGETNIDVALTLKYGEPKTKIKEEPKVFQNGFGAVTTKTEITTFKKWETNSTNIKCEYTHSVSYTVIRGEIYPIYVQLFSLVDVQTQEIIFNLDTKNRERASQIEKERLRKSLDAL